MNAQIYKSHRKQKQKQQQQMLKCKFALLVDYNGQSVYINALSH